MDPIKKIIPSDPHCENRSLQQRHVFSHDVSKMGDFYDGLYGGNSFFCRIQLKFRFLVHKIRWHILCKYQLQIRSHQKGYRQKAFDKLIWNESWYVTQQVQRILTFVAQMRSQWVFSNEHYNTAVYHEFIEYHSWLRFFIPIGILRGTFEKSVHLPYIS